MLNKGYAAFGVALVLAAGTMSAAAAAAPFATVIRLTMTDSTITYADPSVALTGTLTNASGAPLTGRTVTVREHHQGVPQIDLGSVVTDETGTFAFAGRFTQPGYAVVDFAGDETARANQTAAPVNAAERLPTRVFLDPTPPVMYGSQLTLTGRVEIQTPDGSWVPSRFTTVTSRGKGTPGTSSGGSADTDALGRFRLLPSYGYLSGYRTWSVVTWGTAHNYASAAQSETQDLTYLPRPHRISGFKASSRATLHGGIDFSATVERATDGGWTPVPDSAVTLEFQPRGSTTWTAVPFPVSDALRPFKIMNLPPIYSPAPGRSAIAQGSWRLRVRCGDPSICLPAESNALPVDVKVETRLNLPWFSGTRTRVLHSVLSIPRDIGLNPRPVPQGRVRVYYRTKGTKTWRWVKSLTPSRTGAINTSIPSTRNRYYKLVYFPVSPYLATTSPSRLLK